MAYQQKKKYHRFQNAPRAKMARTRTQSTVGLWLLIGMLVGIAGSAALYQLFIHRLKDEPSPVAMDAPVSKRKVKPLRQSNNKASTARFEFYQLLPGMEVPILENVAETTTTPLKALPLNKAPVAAAKSEVDTPTPVAKPHIKVAAPQYLIQTAAYRSAVPAEGLKSRLISQGFSPRIQKIEAEDGIWYRVIVGPFPSETMALHQQNRLAKSHIHGILILQRR
jgi:cell division septation protein DedD